MEQNLENLKQLLRQTGLGIIVVLCAFWTLAFAFVTLFTFPFNDKLGHRLHRRWGRGICRAYGIRVDILFPHHIPAQGGCVLAPNHQSMFDIPILACLPVDFKWISKAEVRRVPLMGWAMVAMGCFFVSRRNSAQDLDVLRGVEEGLKKGKRVVIFPEGTRTRDGNLLPLKKGAFRVAQNAGVPVCPVAIAGSFHIAAPSRLPRHRGHFVSVRIGPPLSALPGEDAASFMQRFRKELVRLLEENSA